MNEEPLFSLKNRWFVVAVGSIGILLLLALIVGFVWIPKSQASQNGGGLWEAICRAAGVPAGASRAWDAPAASVPSDVIVVPNMIAVDNISIGRGATLALRCTMCHGARGMSEADTPNLAGQNAEAIYKQLRDLQSGHRQSEIMAPHTRNLGDHDMRDLAAYYAYLPRETPPSLAEQMAAPRIVQLGAPMRNIAPCMSCHGGSDRKTAAPSLEGEPESYIRTQMLAFAKGTRSNDINGQMRNVARQMTPAEIDEVAKYYAQQ